MLTLPAGLDRDYLNAMYPNANRWGVKFVGWQVAGNTTTYSPNDQISITSDKNVTALWGCPANASLIEKDANDEWVITCECSSGYNKTTLTGGEESCVLQTP